MKIQKWLTANHQENTNSKQQNILYTEHQEEQRAE